MQHSDDEVDFVTHESGIGLEFSSRNSFIFWRHHDKATRRFPTRLSSLTKSNVIDSEAWSALPTTELEDILSSVERAARAAGDIIVANDGCCSSVDQRCEVKFNIKDVVTQYAKQAQEAVEQVIKSEYPSHAFLGEEDVGSGAAASEAALLEALEKTENGWLFILDPIDGTANFASGMPLPAVTMGCILPRNASGWCSVVYDPHRDEMFSAVRQIQTRLIHPSVESWL